MSAPEVNTGKGLEKTKPPFTYEQQYQFFNNIALGMEIWANSRPGVSDGTAILLVADQVDRIGVIGHRGPPEILRLIINDFIQKKADRIALKKFESLSPSARIHDYELNNFRSRAKYDEKSRINEDLMNLVTSDDRMLRNSDGYPIREITDRTIELLGGYMSLPKRPDSEPMP